MLDQRKDEETIFKAASRLETPAEQMAYVRNACGDDNTLLARIMSLLQVHGSKNNLLHALIPDPNVIMDDSAISEGPGAAIGRYKLLEKIGEGGMAVVYMAEQEEPIRRKVALKIIKLGMDTKSVIARFEAERQALAMMDHPNIAKVLDAGATETGRPYFVMELVKGVSITDYCDANSLSTKERLELFIQVCNAVQHAHQKGIIHRDIKPTNVMVTLHDGKPVPKVIDFGIAKATRQKLTEKTLFTRYAHIIGTPAYMSPEQAELSDLDIDTRTDIYSLGVLLYELLTGTPPFGEEELRKAGYIEMQRIIREQEPAKPSTKLSTLGGTLTDVAKRRSATPDLLRKAVRGDLDWIVMKSLEKDRARRYETANGLSLDIQRHIQYEPVLARGPSTAYRLQKFLRRHRSKTIAVLAIALTAGALIVILSMWNQARLQLTEVEGVRYQAEGLRHKEILSHAREQYAKTERDAALETIKPILQSKHVGPEAQLLHAGILVDNRRSDEAVTILGSLSLLEGRPEIAGAAHSLLARIFYQSASSNAETLKQAEQHHQKAEALLPKTAEAYFLRAMFAITVKDQLAALNEALELDLQHYESRRLRAYTYYASRKYDKMREDALVMEVLRPRDPIGYSLRAIALRELGKYEEAIAEYDNAIGLTAKGSPPYIDLSVQRCETLLRMGDYERLVADAQACLKLSPNKPVFQYHIFSALTALGDYDKAAAVFCEIVGRTPTARNEFWFWATKYVFDTLEVEQSWHPLGHEPAGAAFLPMVEAEETYRGLSAKAHRVATNGFSAQWSPDGKKLAFSLGVHGYSGVAVFDPATKETELLIVPGKDPRWSPDGKYIAFVRDCHALRVEELTAAEHEEQMRWAKDEEVWIMNADGAEPRRLALGGWPSWSKDSTFVYYHSRVDQTLCSISLVGRDVEAKRIMSCPSYRPSVSPDNQRVAYVEDAFLKVRDLASQALVAQWRVPFDTWGGPAWSPTGEELCLGAGGSVGDRTGLWIYPLDSNEPVKVLDSQIMAASWASGGTKLVFGLRPPYFEIWAADLDPDVSTIEALGPGQTLDEHWQDMLRLYTRRMQADPQDASAYADRARYYDYLEDREQAKADMSRWSAVVSSKSPSDFQVATPRNLRRIINCPFDYKIVFSAERPVNETPILNVAFGQKPSGSFVQPGCDSSTQTAKKGRCNMKSFKMPILSTSLLGLCLLSGLDAPPARADFTFGVPANLGPMINNAGSNQAFPCLSPDGLELYFCRVVSGALYDIFVTRRATVEGAWGEPIHFGPPVNTSAHEWALSMSADGLSLYYTYGGDPTAHLYVTKRATKNGDWGPPASVGGVVGSEIAVCPCISPNGLELYFASGRSGGYGNYDLWVTTRATVNDPWGAPANLGPTINSPSLECDPVITPDGLSLFFSSTRPGGNSGQDIYVTRRTTPKDPWGPCMNLGPILNRVSGQRPGGVSFDGSILYFFCSWPGGYSMQDIWQAPIIRIVDFNGDGKVDGKDVLHMVSHWATDDSLCDIGPFAWGDGIVGLEDLTVLADYLVKEFSDPTLVAHWALDETQGSTTRERVSGCDDVVLGGLWQPTGGQVAGAIQLDGADDYVIATFALNPAKGPLSVLAWVKGGTPGQVAISEPTAANWLMADAEGKLRTELQAFGRTGAPLQSQTIITDGQWHRIGLVWDGSRRTLYVDGIVAAEDTQSALPSSGNGLYIGTGKNMESGTFWSGLIDDVRIYNRAVRP